MYIICVWVCVRIQYICVHTHTRSLRYNTHYTVVYYFIIKKKWRRVQLLLYYYKMRSPYSLMAVANTHHHVIVRACIMNPSAHDIGRYIQYNIIIPQVHVDDDDDDNITTTKRTTTLLPEAKKIRLPIIHIIIYIDDILCAYNTHLP